MKHASHSPASMLTIHFETFDITPKLLENDKRLRAFWFYWLETARRYDGFKALAKDDIRPESFKGYLEYLTLTEVVNDGADFRYRIYGTGIAKHFGRDMTGALVSDLPPVSAEFQLYFYQQALRKRQPVYMITEGHPNIQVDMWARLCLPVTTSGDRVEMLLNLALPTRLRGTPAQYL